MIVYGKYELQQLDDGCGHQCIIEQMGVVFYE